MSNTMKYSKQQIIDRINQIYLLKSFLQKEKIYFKFIHRAMNPLWRGTTSFFFTKFHFIDSIYFSFLWARTPEGEVYWSDINDKFKIYYKSNSEI